MRALGRTQARRRGGGALVRLRRLWRRLHHTQRACALFQRKARAEVGNSSASAYGTVRETHYSPAAQILHVAIQHNPVLDEVAYDIPLDTMHGELESRLRRLNEGGASDITVAIREGWVDE